MLEIYPTMSFVSTSVIWLFTKHTHRFIPFQDCSCSVKRTISHSRINETYDVLVIRLLPIAEIFSCLTFFPSEIDSSFYNGLIAGKFARFLSTLLTPGP